MANRLMRLAVRNYRSLADMSVDLGAVNVLFGPNGSGKSTLLDTMWFFRGCAVRGVELASAERSHGINILYDGAGPEDLISIALATEDVEYVLRVGLSAGRIEPFVGERLFSNTRQAVLIDRKVGSDKASLYHAKMKEPVLVNLREPEKLSLGRYLDFEDKVDEAVDFDRLLRSTYFYHCRSFNFYNIKQKGSEIEPGTRLSPRGDNVWSVLRNLHDRQRVDRRYDTIMNFMAESFPSFDGLLLEQTGPGTIYSSFLEKGRHNPIRASGVSDGQIEMLLVLTGLFADAPHRDSVVLFDEPDLSLHPWALAVLAKAIQHAVDQWKRQVVIATHSPVLLSQFEVDQILAAEVKQGRTQIKRLSEMDEIKDLLERYAAGSLYMAQVIGAQAADAEAAEVQ